MGEKNFETKILYKGSVDGMTAKEFHARCDGKGPTLSLYKVKDGPCIGGFTHAQW
jgi:TLD